MILTFINEEKVRATDLILNEIIKRETISERFFQYFRTRVLLNTNKSLGTLCTRQIKKQKERVINIKSVLKQPSKRLARCILKLRYDGQRTENDTIDDAEHETAKKIEKSDFYNLLVRQCDYCFVRVKW